MTSEDIERILQEGNVDSIFPVGTPENDPWNVDGGVVEGGENAWNVGWNNDISDPRFSSDSCVLYYDIFKHLQYGLPSCNPPISRRFPISPYIKLFQQFPHSATLASSPVEEQDITKSLEVLSLEPSVSPDKETTGAPLDKDEPMTPPSEKGALPLEADNNSPHDNSDKGSPVDWNGATDETKIKLSKWGELYLEGVRSEVNQ